MNLDLKEGVSLVQVDSRLQEVHSWQHEDGDLSLSELVKNNSIVWIPKSSFSQGKCNAQLNKGHYRVENKSLYVVW